MSTTIPVPGDIAEPVAAATNLKEKLTSRMGSALAILLGIVWTVPTLGLFITSIRPGDQSSSTGWWVWLSNPQVTFQNYQSVLFEGSKRLDAYFLNSLVLTIPAVILPVILASIAAYAFAWIKFRGRDTLFVVIFALQIVPLQVALIPLLLMYSNIGITGTFWAIWISHTIFGLPLAIYLLHNFMKEIPGELIEAARVDGCGHVRIFVRIMLPLLVPALAAFSVFQFLWVWNDLLVALVFGSSTKIAPLTVRVSELSGTYGTKLDLVSAGAFVSIIVPLLVFIALQRFFVRGLLAGSVKG